MITQLSNDHDDENYYCCDNGEDDDINKNNNENGDVDQVYAWSVYWWVRIMSVL